VKEGVYHIENENSCKQSNQSTKAFEESKTLLEKLCGSASVEAKFAKSEKIGTSGLTEQNRK
jgi:hypothetical protein